MVDKKKKGGLAKRYKASYESKGSSGGKAGVMNWGKVDGDVQFFSPTEGKNRINIIPYTIKTKNHPLVKKGEFEVGDSDYVMDVFVHRGVGPSEASVLCLKQTYGKPCPICEQSALLRKQGKEDEASALKPSRRVFYNIQDMKNPDTLKVFEASHFLFEKELIDEARDDDEGGFVDFADSETGKEIKFRTSKVSRGGFEFNEFKSFSFEDRDENIPDELLEKAISFDEIMNVPTYEEAEKILYGRDDNEDEDDDEQEDEAPAKKTKPSKKVVEEDEEEEDEEDESAPKPSEKTKTPAVENDDEQENEENEENEAPVKKPAKKEKDCKGDCGKCPFGHKFGVDTDGFDDCDDCDVWDKCINGGK